jgi:hypothetical protein
MMANVGDIVAVQDFLDKLPHPIHFSELVMVSTRGDDLQRKVGQALQHCKVAASTRRKATIVNLDNEVRNYVSGAGTALVHCYRSAVPANDLCRTRTSSTVRCALKKALGRAVCKQGANGLEIGRVYLLGIEVSEIPYLLDVV